MDISIIDNLAYNIDSVMHRASALSKIVMVVFVVTTVVISTNPIALAFGLVLLILTILASNLPVARVLSLVSYAFFFSLIFALSQVGGGLIGPLVIVLKAVTAAVSLVLLITTTPYPQIFAILQKVLPNILVDAMLVTYKSLFIIIGQVNNIVIAMRIRDGYSPLNIVKNLSNTGKIVGHGVIHAWELGESMQEAMFVRGYKGKLPLTFSWSSISGYDVFPLLVGAAILAAAV